MMFAEDLIERNQKQVKVSVRGRRRVSTNVAGRDLDSLKKQKEYLVCRLNDIDKQRNQFKSQLRALHGQAGRSKIVARIKSQDSKLLADRNDTCQQIGDIKKLIKVLNQEIQPKHEVLAANFMRLAKERLPDELYKEILEDARTATIDSQGLIEGLQEKE
ncbi:MAG: hypothetical protein D6B27_04300 [Gammaproteobacteria bacterium]|nr:MAG: hypothetical protein D6B27_04300 [Gammaproteobacteria bacterium]